MSAQSQIKDEYPLCQSPGATIGEVPDRPFTARVEEGLRRIQRDGNSVHADSKPDSQVGLAVRASSGRVMIVSRIKTAESAEGNVHEWSETVCDPTKGTVTFLKLRALKRPSGSGPVIPRDPDAYNPTGAEGTALVEVQRGHTTAVFAYWHNSVDGRKNLGPETFEGLPAYCYRLMWTRDERSARDIVNSDELLLQLAITKWKTYPEIEDEIRLTDIHLSEPRQELFDIPPSVHVITTTR